MPSTSSATSSTSRTAHLQRLNQIQGRRIGQGGLRVEPGSREKRCRGAGRGNLSLQLCARLHHSQHLEGMIREEEEHIDTLETELEVINSIGIGLYLNRQIRGED